MKAYLNSDVMRLFRTLITGVEITDFEAVLADGLGIVRRRAVVDTVVARRRSCLTLLGLSQSPLDTVAVSCCSNIIVLPHLDLSLKKA